MAQAATKQTDTDNVVPIDAGRKLPEVDPSFVKVNTEGFAWRDILVRLPDGAIADDLKEPGLWRRVQNNVQVALRKHDHLYIVAYDETWAADCVVTHATNTVAVLSKPRLISFDERTKPFYCTEDFTVAWYGNGFAVKRLKDGQRVSTVVTSEAVAERDLQNMYDRKPGR
jgi:hypothetical protein